MSQRILLCDDEVHILRAAEFKLARAGYQVSSASDGQEALESIRKERPDLLITDCQMPRMDGPGLIEALRSDPSTRDLPIIMLTAKGLEIARDERLAEWKLADVVAKPFSPRELLARVERVVPLAARQSNSTSAPPAPAGAPM
jgi:two-component system alkaline phosphatase synthesis response regulator PhoP